MSAKKTRLDAALVEKGLVLSRSQAESFIKLGKVTVNGKLIKKSGFFVNDNSNVNLDTQEQYVSRAGLKLASVAQTFKLDFKNKVVLDVGSSTGGFTDYALKHGAKKVIAVDVGTEQLHPSLRNNPKIELHEKTDIRQFTKDQPNSGNHKLSIDMVVMDVSFISVRDVLPYIAKITSSKTQIISMVKPQFEARKSDLMHKGVIKNDRIRRKILSDFEGWAKQSFVIKNKADSQVAGARGNLERFYLLSTYNFEHFTFC